MATSNPTVEASMTVRVSRAAPGDLVAGVRSQIERVDGVTVADLELAGLEPGLNDLTVETVARLHVRDTPRDTDAVERRLAEGFGVDPDRVDPVEPPDR